MKPLASALIVLAGLAVAAGCSTLAGPVDPLPRGMGWQDAGTPPSSAALQRVTRHDVDDKGVLWDDRGRKLDAANPASREGARS